MCTYIEEECLKYDFLINNKKIQEKVCSIVHKKNGTTTYGTSLYNNNGIVNQVRQFKSYKKGENDFYWIWIKGERCFYVIPEKPLLDHGKIDEGVHGFPMKRSYLSLDWKCETKWYSEYKFDLNNIDKARLKNMFE
jgi:hypothetical protein